MAGTLDGNYDELSQQGDECGLDEMGLRVG